MEVVTRESWFGRIGKSFVGVIFGIILSIAAFPVLFINEGRAVKTATALKEGARAVVSVAAEELSASNEGNFVHLSGRAHCEREISDDAFGVAATAIRLHRDVEMYQWKEHESSETRKRLGGGTETVTTYSYSKTWSSSRINSSGFRESGHNNPSDMPVSSKTNYASDVTVGAFHLPHNLVTKISDDKPLNVDAAGTSEEISGNVVQDGPNGLYWSRGGSAGSPEIGDLRIRFSATYPTDVSVMAKQQGNTFAPYETSNGRELYLLSMGNVSAADMIAEQEMNNRILTWVLRGVGTFMMFIGFVLMARPLAVIADVIPFLGSAVGAVSAVAVAIFALPLSLATISIGWLIYHPLIGVPLFAGSIVLFVVIVKRMRKKSPPAIPAVPASSAAPPPLP